jgi:hypothetical protein
MLPIPLVIQSYFLEPEIRREVHDEPHPSLEQIPHHTSTLHVRISNERNVE